MNDRSAGYVYVLKECWNRRDIEAFDVALDRLNKLKEIIEITETDCIFFEYLWMASGRFYVNILVFFEFNTMESQNCISSLVDHLFQRLGDYVNDRTVFELSLQILIKYFNDSICERVIDCEYSSIFLEFFRSFSDSVVVSSFISTILLKVDQPTGIIIINPFFDHCILLKNNICVKAAIEIIQHIPSLLNSESLREKCQFSILLKAVSSLSSVNIYIVPQLVRIIHCFRNQKSPIFLSKCMNIIQITAITRLFESNNNLIVNSALKLIIFMLEYRLFSFDFAKELIHLCADQFPHSCYEIKKLIIVFLSKLLLVSDESQSLAAFVPMEISQQFDEFSTSELTMNEQIFVDNVINNVL